MKGGGGEDVIKPQQKEKQISGLIFSNEIRKLKIEKILRRV